MKFPYPVHSFDYGYTKALHFMCISLLCLVCFMLSLNPLSGTPVLCPVSYQPILLVKE